MTEQSEFERVREGTMILLDSDEVEYFQVVAGTEDGPIALSAARDHVGDPDYELFAAFLLKILADSGPSDLEELSERVTEQARALRDAPEQ
ncbi:MAG: hypothetical protein QXG03_05875 [Halalkalicoccus sp.]